MVLSRSYIIKMNDPITFRLINPHDSVEEINSLLRRSYSALAKDGMKYAASHEDVEKTQKNINLGECHLAIQNEKIIGCGLLKTSRYELDPKFYSEAGVMVFGRFAVEPSLQGQGIGKLFMNYIENRAKELEAKTLALDTSEKASHLIQMYEKRGYQFVCYHQWSITNYRSVVMSKKL